CDRGSQSQAATTWHGIARIHSQIQNDLRELAGIDFDVSALFLTVQMGNDGDVFAQETQERALKVYDDRIDLNDMRLKRLFAAKSKQLPGQVGGSTGGFANLLHMAGDRSLHPGFGQDQIAVTENGGQKIV